MPYPWEVAIKVLYESGRETMHYKDITEAVKKLLGPRGLSGETPWETLNRDMNKRLDYFTRGGYKGLRPAGFEYAERQLHLKKDCGARNEAPLLATPTQEQDATLNEPELANTSPSEVLLPNKIIQGAQDSHGSIAEKNKILLRNVLSILETLPDLDPMTVPEDEDGVQISVRGSPQSVEAALMSLLDSISPNKIEMIITMDSEGYKVEVKS